MFKLLKRFTVIIASFFSLTSTSALADEVPLCYQLTMANSPVTDAQVVAHKETWCYQKLSYPQGSVFVFNAETDKILPELSFTIDADGVLTHSSLKQGRRTIHKVLAKEFNPFSIPLEAPEYLPSLPRQYFTFEMGVSANEALRILSSQPAQFHSVNLLDGENLEMDVGTFEADADIKPWRGYWWAYNGRPLSNGSNSPMAKYDKFVEARTGTNPGAQRWENSRHRYHGIVWEGHCNGWAASSVLRPEPKTSKTDDLSGMTFSVSDQKGLLAETDYCAKVAFFGKRNNGSGNSRDIRPDLFHKTLLYYIGDLQKPIATDYKPMAEVDNHVISGYTMKIRKTGTYTYAVTTKVRIHKYDKARSSTPGDAPMYTRTYSYRLTEKEDGSYTGTWTSGNPDFLWVPLASMDCDRNNPNINHDFIQQILDLAATSNSN